jgi:hypothetical protein
VSWAEYHYHDLVTFFALPRELNRELGLASYRWIVKVDADRGAVYFLHLTSSDRPIALEEFAYDAPPDLTNCVNQAISSNAPLTEEGAPLTFVDKVDFDAIGGSAISRSWTIETWDGALAPNQKKVRDLPSGSNIRIVGPAGSGKTLTLCIRALSEIRKAAKDGRPLRALFATHSWAMAERVDDTLQTLNGGVSVAEITVYPLLQVLRDVLGRSYASSLSILGEDSAEGRKLQFDLLSESLSSISKSDRVLLSAQMLSPHVRVAMDSNPGELAWIELVEDLYEEINGVLLAEGLLPGDRKKEEEYLSQSRSDDLPPFSCRGDRSMVLLVYRDFVKRLRNWGYVTTDQLVSDATKILETFSWSVKRESEGYDLILIDELQLFDAQERFALTLLTSSSETAAFNTAEDPSQGIFSAISAQWRREVTTKGRRESIELSGSHRFSDGILLFVKHLYLAFPLNAPMIPIEQQAQAAVAGSPVLYRVHSEEECAKTVARLAQSSVADLRGDERLAVICLDGASESVARELTRLGLNVSLIRSLEDVERLSYSKRSVVVGDWQFLGGTQFSHVIVSSGTGSVAKSSFGRIRELTALYVAASRAAKMLNLVIGGRAHAEIDSAVTRRLLQSE